MAVIIKYWPAVVAGLYLAYVLAAGQTNQIQPAIAAFIAAFGVNHVAATALRKAEAAHVASYGCRGKHI